MRVFFADRQRATVTIVERSGRVALRKQVNRKCIRFFFGGKLNWNRLRILLTLVTGSALLLCKILLSNCRFFPWEDC